MILYSFQMHRASGGLTIRKGPYSDFVFLIRTRQQQQQQQQYEDSTQTKVKSVCTDHFPWSKIV